VLQLNFLNKREEDVSVDFSAPFFSIGVTTYNRPEMLKECLQSVIGQTFSDFEVIVGNDYPSQMISDNFLSVYDPRIRFVNHSRNIGEINNMNKLREISRGKYFTWLADDDMYAPTFLETIYSVLDKYNFPQCIFTSYMPVRSLSEKHGKGKADIQVLDGRQFLQKYLSRQIKVIGCYGVFDRRYIRDIGGIEYLGNGFSPYADNLLVVKAALQKEVVYINAPLIFFRTHDQSISYTSPDVDAYSSAQKDFLSKSIEVFGSEGLSEDYRSNLFLLLKWCLSDYCTVMRRSGTLRFGQLIKYLWFLMSYLKKIKGHRCKMMAVVLRSVFNLMKQMAGQSGKDKISPDLRKIHG
jgi:glycosyltransferase involved in cell wall biosynthesis